MHNHVFTKEILYSNFTNHYPLVYFSLSGPHCLVWTVSAWVTGPPPSSWATMRKLQAGPSCSWCEYHTVFVCIIMQYFQVQYVSPRYWYYLEHHIMCKIQFIQRMLNSITISQCTTHFRQNAIECLYMNSIVTLLQRLLSVDKVRLKIWIYEHMHCWMNTVIEIPPADALDHYPICSLRCRTRKQTKPTKRSTLKPMQFAESCPPCLEAL